MGVKSQPKLNIWSIPRGFKKELGLAEKIILRRKGFGFLLCKGGYGSMRVGQTGETWSYSNYTSNEHLEWQGWPIGNRH